MSLNQGRRIRLLGVLLALLTAWTTTGHAASCETSSGSECTVSCSQGTATATCSNNSKKCSTSCTDSSGNMERFLIYSLSFVTDGRIDEDGARDLLRYEVDVESLFSHGADTRRISTSWEVITIDVDRQW